MVKVVSVFSIFLRKDSKISVGNLFIFVAAVRSESPEVLKKNHIFSLLTFGLSDPGLLNKLTLLLYVKVYSGNTRWRRHYS